VRLSRRGQASTEYVSISVLLSILCLAALVGTPVRRGLVAALQEYVDYFLYALNLPLT
jgi:hypothetical protein